MGKYLKKFDNHTQYDAFIKGESVELYGEYILPNVSHCIEENEVHYNPIKYYITSIYNVTDDAQPTQLYNCGYNDEATDEYIIDGLGIFDNIEVDNVNVNILEIDEADGKYQLTNGEHIVKYALKDPTIISRGMFLNCKNLTSVLLPITVLKISSDVFYGCSNLSNFTIPSDVTYIGDGAFSQCTSITTITIPDKVTEIKHSILYGCNNLNSIISLAVTPPTLGEWVFGNTNDCPIYVPSESVDAYKAATNWSTYASRIQAIPTA